MDDLQFAYSKGLGVDDAVLTVLHTLRKHVDKLGTKARLLFADFSSAFNAISLYGFRVSNRLEYVNFNGTLLDGIEINIGVPQGCVLSAVLFIIYTADCRSLSKHVIVNYADDTVIVGLMSNEEDVTTYCQFFRYGRAIVNQN